MRTQNTLGPALAKGSSLHEKQNTLGVVMKHRALSIFSFVLITACGTSKNDMSSEDFDKAVASNEKLAQEVEALRDERSQVSNNLEANNEKVSALQDRIDELNKSG